MFHKNRLLKLANFLETVKPKDFNLSSWKRETTNGVCKTICCAVGFAATIPSFKKAGLRLSSIDKNNTFVFYNDEDVTEYQIHYEQWESWSAVGKFFGLNSEEYNYLFSDTYYGNFNSGPKHVAKRIKKFIETSKVSQR